MTKDIYINDVYIPLLDCESRYLLLYGGSGSGKSVFAAQKIVKRVLSEQGHRFLCVRKVANTLQNSIFQLIKDIIVEWGVYAEFVINKTEKRFTHIATGNEILLSGLDDVERLKSITAITGIWVEEATELESSELTQLSLRLRGETINYKQIILSFNPIDQDHWIKKEYFDKKSIDTTALRTTYLDNEFIDEEYKAELNGRVKGNENYYRIYVLGEWGRIQTGNEFYSGFVRSKHIADTPFLPGEYCHLSFDFNVHPYMTLLCAQLVRNELLAHTQIRIFKEYPLRTPLNTVEALCKTFLREYEAYKPIVLYYGDATGKNRIAGQGDKRNFDDVEKYLLKYLTHASDRVIKRNPNVLKRRDVINRMFAGGYPGISIVIDPSCKELIKDLDYVKQGIDGKHKEMYNDKDLGVSYQKLGHLSDAMDYLLAGLYPNEFRF